MATDGTAPEVEEKSFSCIYFGFASNLSPRNLQGRCPGALHVGLARLRGWRFIVTQTGFGNIVPSPEGQEDEVYGNLFFLTPKHEAALDKSEEVPKWHQKRNIQVTRMTTQKKDGNNSEEEELVENGAPISVMTYIDVSNMDEGIISKEYIPFLLKAVDDGMRCGVPKEYFDRYFRKFLPADASVGREQKMVMQRTIQVDREDLRFVPSDLLRK